jgi:hypothetical protein
MSLTDTEEDQVTTDEILWLHKIFGSPATGQQAFIPITTGVPHTAGPAGFDGACQSVSVAGTSGLTPLLTGVGTLVFNTQYTIRVSQAKPSASGILYSSTHEGFNPFSGGLLVPQIPSLLPFTTSAVGRWNYTATWTGAAGTTTFYQAWVQETGNPQGAYAGSNGLMAVGQ